MKLRDYQIEIIDRVHKERRKHNRLLLVAGCGAGKTVIASQLICDFVSQGLRVLFLVDRDNLVSQTADKFSKFGIHFGYIKAGYDEDRTASAQIASIQTLAKRQWWQNHQYDVIVYDEAHELCYSQIAQKLINEIYPDALHLGLTATPWRLKRKENLGDIFQKMISSPVPSKLQELGHLCEGSYFGVRKVDLSEVKKNGTGDYIEKQLSVACNKEPLIKAIADDWLTRCNGLRTIAFCVDIAHAIAVRDEFRRRGVPSVEITAKTPTRLREIYYGKLRKREILVITSVGVLCKGFDEPSVECALLLRPTLSLPMHFQQVGRVQRISAETNKQGFIILDQAGNLAKHGIPEVLTQYRLTRTGEDDGEENPVPMKECPGVKADGHQCGAFLYGFVMTCPHCGHVFEAAAEKKITEPVKLERYFKDQNEEKRFREYQDIVRKSQHINHARVLYNQRFGFYPKGDWSLYARYGENYSESNVLEWYHTLKLLAEKKGHGEGFVTLNMGAEFGKGNWERIVKEKYTGKPVVKVVKPVEKSEGNLFLEWVS